MMKKYLLVLPLLFYVTGLAAEPASRESVTELMAVSGASQQFEQMGRMIMPSIRQMAPDAPDSFWADLEQELNPQAMLAEVIPVYQKNLSEADVRAAISFMKSPAGRHFVEAQPQIMQESMAIGQMWMQRATRKVMERYQQQIRAPQKAPQ